MIRFLFATILSLAVYNGLSTTCNQPIKKFNVLVLYEIGGWHTAYTLKARGWLDQLALDSSFNIEYIHNTDSIDEIFLSNFQLFIQLDYPPYGWKSKAEKAFINYIEQGKGGWIGFHHATLLGEFDGFPMWNWFSSFMGNIRYKDYIPTFASAEVHIEDTNHPVLHGVPNIFLVKQEEWYTYDKSPRSEVRVLATVDESSYEPNTVIKMGGDHPVIWTNEKVKARNIYMFMGHSPILFENQAYLTIVKNSIFWAAKKNN